MRIFPALYLSILALAHHASAEGDLDAYGVSVNDTNPDPGDLVTVRWTAINRTGDFIGSSNQGVMFSTDFLRAEEKRSKSSSGILSERIV